MNDQTGNPYVALDIHTKGKREGFVTGVIFSVVVLATYRRFVKKSAPPEGPFVVN